MKRNAIVFFVFAASLANGQKRNTLPELLEKLKTAKDTIRVKTFIEIGFNYFIQDQQDSVLYYNEQALDLSEKLNWPKGIARAYLNIGNYYSAYNNDEKAMELYLKSLKISEDNKYYGNAGNAIVNIANIYTRQKKYDLALEKFFQGVRLGEKAKDTTLLILLYGNIADVYHSQKKMTEVYEYVHKGLSLTDVQLKKPDLDPVSFARIMDIKPLFQRTQAFAFMEEKRYDTAIVLLKEALEYIKQKGGTSDHADFLLSITECYNNLHQYSTALKYSNQALELLKTDRNPEGYSSACEQLGIAYAGLGDYEKAYKLYVDFRRINDSILSKENLRITTEMETKYQTEKKDREIAQLNREKRFQRTITGLAIGASVITLGFLAFIIRSRRLQKKLFAEKEKLMLKEKEIEINSLHRKMGELEQMALRAQMNPHFIFNSLNSVQHYVMKQDVEGVNKYLGAFANLIRQTLDNSGKQFISLDEEIKYLETYLSLEKMKCNDRFTYDIDIAGNIDKRATYIPGMILQPFVENSIKHGVAYKEANDGHISIRVTKNGRLNCEIRDNGVGRQRAGELKSAGGDAGYESKGIGLTKSRIEAINKIYNAGISVEINDTSGADGEPGGTVVSINFPVSID